MTMTFEDGDDRDGLVECSYCGFEFPASELDDGFCEDCADELSDTE